MENTDRKIISVEAILTRISYTKDGGLSLGFSTQEMSPEDKLKMSELYQQFGWLAFSPNKIDLSDMPKVDAEFAKSHSKQLRGKLYKLSKARNVKDEDFEAFYREQMQKLLDYVDKKVEIEI